MQSSIEKRQQLSAERHEWYNIIIIFRMNIHSSESMSYTHAADIDGCRIVPDHRKLMRETTFGRKHMLSN
jgi:hypothetical protein